MGILAVGEGILAVGDQDFLIGMTRGTWAVLEAVLLTCLDQEVEVHLLVMNPVSVQVVLGDAGVFKAY